MLKNCLPFQGFVICGDEVGLPLLCPLCLWQGEGHTSTLSFKLSPSAPMLGIQAFLNITNSAHTWACQTFQDVTHAASNVFSLLYLFWPFWIAQLNLALALKARRLQHFSISDTPLRSFWWTKALCGRSVTKVENVLLMLCMKYIFEIYLTQTGFCPAEMSFDHACRCNHWYDFWNERKMSLLLQW